MTHVRTSRAFARGLAWGAAIVLVAAIGGGHAEAATKSSKKSTKSSKSAKPAVPDSNEVLVRVGKDVIRRSDVQRRIDALPEQFRANYSTPEGRQQLLDRMVEEKIWLVRATQEGVPARPQVQQQIDQQRRDLVIRTYLNDLMATNPAVSDSEAKVYYDEHVAEYRVPATINARHIQTKTEADAKKALQAARKGQDWATLVKKMTTDTLTKSNGGNLGTITKGGSFGSLGMQPVMADSAFAQKDGAIIGPFKTDHGWQVLRIDSVKPESVRPFDQVKPLIARQLGQQRQQDFYKLQLDEARKSLGVTPDSAAIKRFVSQKKTAREMFNEAQALGPPDQRIEAYKKMLAEYPQSEVSPQAQFMIGFIYSEELKDYDHAEEAFKTLLARYPNAELAPSAQWMIGHMRSEDAPAFINLDSDSTTAAPAEAPKSGTGKSPKPNGAKSTPSKGANAPRSYRP